MRTARNKYYILNFAFLFCVLILFLNDHYLKFSYPGWLTGKLSDAMGIIILPLLLAFVFPGFKHHVLWISALLFVFWKSGYSQPLVDFYNSFSFIGTSRVVDPTDLYVLVFLPIPDLIINRIDDWGLLKIDRVNPFVVLLPTIFILMSTTPPPSFYYRQNHVLRCFNCSITVKYQQDEIVEKLRKAEIVFDSTAPATWIDDENAHIYRLNRFIIDRDTLKNLEFVMRTFKSGKTKISFFEMQVPAHISTLKLAKKMKKYYSRAVFRELRNGLK